MSQLKKLKGSQNFAANEFNRNFESRDERVIDTESETESESQVRFKKNIDLGIKDNIFLIHFSVFLN